MGKLIQKFALANDTAVRYVDSTDGERCIVFIHGYLETADVWEPLMEHLKHKFRVIAFDIPGHGISETRHEVNTMEYVADTLHDLLVQTGVKKCTLIGHSMGGYVALAFAKKYNDMTAGLILLHSTPDPDTDEKRGNREREIKIIESGRKELLAKTNPGKGFAAVNRKKFAEEINDLGMGVIETDDDGITALLKGMAAREDMSGFLKEIKQPVMMIFGEQDEYMPAEYTKELAERYPEATTVMLENSGHMGFIEQEKDVLNAIETFMEKVK